MIFLTSFQHTVSNFLFPNAVWLFYFSLEIFILTPLNWIIHKNYDFHLIFFYRDINKALDDRKNNPENKFIIKIYTFEYYEKFSLWVSVFTPVSLHLLNLTAIEWNCVNGLRSSHQYYNLS